MGFSHVLRFCLQGGGVYIGGGTVSFSLCTITGNTAGDVRAHAQKFPSPRWDFYMFCACACRAVVSLSMEAQWPSHRAPSVGTQLHMCALKSSHRPDGKMADVLASTLARTTATDALVNYRMCVPQRPSKVPIAPMGDSQFARCLQGGGINVDGGKVSIVNSQVYSNQAARVRAHLLNSHHPLGVKRFSLMG